MRVRIRVMLVLSWVLWFTSIDAVAQDTYSGCGLLLEGENGCWVFFSHPDEFFVIKNIGSFGNFDNVYVTIMDIGDCLVFGKCECVLDNTIEQCPECGDGLVGPGEECDDQDLDDGDGCSSICAVEEGFACAGEPSVCTRTDIPATSTWGTVILTLLLLSAGTICLRRRARLLACFGALMFAGAAFAQSPKLDVPHHPERLLVRFKGATSKTAQQSVHTALGSTELKAYRHVDGLVLVHVSAEELATALDAYLARPEVLYAEPDFKVHFIGTPNDPDFGQLWGLYNTGQTVNGDPGTPGADIRAVEAWDFWTGDQDFRIAVIDTGVDYNHPDLQANIWTNDVELNGQPGVDDDNNGCIDDIHGCNFINDPPNGDVMDDHVASHGTHVAGTIGAVGNNSTGVVGVNWSCSIVALKIAFTSDAVEAMHYVIDEGIKVSNNSWECTLGCGNTLCYSQALYDVIQQSQGVGHIFVAAAGNGIPGLGIGFDNDECASSYPSLYDLPNIISVAATDNDDKKPTFSNWGPISIDIGAPGVDVYSTKLQSQGSYGFLTGTSMATPHVTGVVALLRSRRPELTWEQVRDRVLLTARPIATLAGRTVTGGVVNALAAVADCNGNGILDEQDIAGGTSDDCNANALPDECEPDCNGNEVADGCDISAGTSNDCNGNGIPDECEPDCNGNGVADSCDVTAGTSNDCNENMVPDECEPGWDQDCNNNTIADLCDIFAGTSNDCNTNSVPDDCDIAVGTSEDCTGNGIPDECEPDCNDNGVPDSCDIAAGTSQDLNGDGIPDECPTGFVLLPIAASGVHTVDEEEIVLVGGGQRVFLEIWVSGWDPDLDGSPRVLIYEAGIDDSGFTSGQSGSLALSTTIPCINNDDCLGSSPCGENGFCEAEGAINIDESHPDWIFAQASGSVFTAVSIISIKLGALVFDIPDAVVDTGLQKYLGTLILDVSADAVGTFTVEFTSVHTLLTDVGPGGGTGQEFSVGENPGLITVLPDCNGNGVADSLDPDCDGNGVPDDCEPFEDCNNNGVSDPCELACGPPGGACNVSGCGMGTDCNGNCIPDDCDLNAGTSQDCNLTGIPDECDISSGTSQDCTGNGIPDECEPDCQLNDVPDSCDIAGGTSEDCQPNGIPDECDLTSGFSQDCNDNAVPDECDLTGGFSQDCNTNNIPDECDLTSGFSQDCTGNGIPDECEPDCQLNDVPDSCDIAGGTSEDCQPNGIPDECDLSSGTSQDCNSNGVPDECGNGCCDVSDCNLAEACCSNECVECCDDSDCAGHPFHPYCRVSDHTCICLTDADCGFMGTCFGGTCCFGPGCAQQGPQQWP